MDSIKKNIIQALKDCYGIVTDACRKANVPRSTYYKWLNEDPDFKAAVEDTQEEAIDFVEGKLFQKINGVKIGKLDDGELNVYDQPPSDTAIIFYLKTKAKKRGYVERQEFAGVEGSPLVWKETKVYDSEQKADNSSGLSGGQ